MSLRRFPIASFANREPGTFICRDGWCHTIEVGGDAAVVADKTECPVLANAVQLA